MIETRVAITTPPSVNSLYANKKGGGRRKSETYKCWIRTAGQEIMAQRRKITPIRGPYSIVIKVAKGTKGDIDNRAKATLDLLVSMGITDDDKHCQRCTVERGLLEQYTEVFVTGGEGNGVVA